MSESEEEMNILAGPEPISIDELTSMVDKVKIGKKSKAQKEIEFQEEQARLTIKSKGIEKKRN